MNIDTLIWKLRRMCRDNDMQFRQNQMGRKTLKPPTDGKKTVVFVSHSWQEGGVTYSHALAYLYDTDGSHRFVDGGGERTTYYSTLRLPAAFRLFSKDVQGEHETCAVYVLLSVHLFAVGVNFVAIKRMFERDSIAINDDTVCRYMERYHKRAYTNMRLSYDDTATSLNKFQRIVRYLGHHGQGRPRNA